MVLAGGPHEVVVVTGFESARVERTLEGLPIRIQRNPRFEEGQMTSVAAGVGGLVRGTDAVMVCLGDMVLLTGSDYRELVEAFGRIGSKSILVPHYQRKRGNPVLFASWHVPGICAGRPNPGCRKLIAEYPEQVFAYEASHDGFVSDIDTPQDYACLLGRLGLPASSLMDHAA
jgi:molybdenum cofactor cytidylyltransferase